MPQPSAHPRQVLYIAPDRPWARWTNSGVSLEVATRLKQLGLLYGALSRYDTELSSLHGPNHLRMLWDKVAHRLRGGRPDPGKAGREWRDERDGVIGRVLSTLPPGTAVLYHYVVPEPDLSLPIRRFLFQDMAVEDGVKGGGFGYDKKSPAEIKALHDHHARVYPHIDGVISFASFVADSLADHYAFPREKVFAIGAGPIRRFPSLPPQPVARYAARRILFVGRAWERKGGPIVLEAFEQVRSVYPDATLTVVSSMAKFEPRPGVTHIPFASDEQLHQLFSSASIFTMPSLCETWGLVYCEAAAHALPTANFDNWALPDIVEHGATGVLTPRHTAQGLADALIDGLRDPARLQRMGAAAARRVHDVLDWPHVMDRLLAAIVPEALQGRSPVWMRPR